MRRITPDDDVAVIGAGTMGAGIAEVAARAGHAVRLHDARPAAAQRRRRGLRRRLDRDVARGRLDRDEADAVLAPRPRRRRLDDLAGCGSSSRRSSRTSRSSGRSCAPSRTSPGRAWAARSCWRRTPRRCRSPRSRPPCAAPDCSWGCTSSTPRRGCRSSRWSAATRPTRRSSTRPPSWSATGARRPSSAPRRPGFVVNRVARPFYGEAQRLAEAGVAAPATIDAVLREAGGFPMGPFQLTDLVGQDVNLAVSTLGVGADLPRPAVRADALPAPPRGRRPARPQDRPRRLHLHGRRATPLDADPRGRAAAPGAGVRRARRVRLRPDDAVPRPGRGGRRRECEQVAARRRAR